MISDERFALLDLKDWILINDVEDDDLKKWIKYRAMNYPDADEVLKIYDDMGCILVELGWYGSDVNQKEQYIDCIFSMATFFNAFLRFYASDNKISASGRIYYAQLLENYDDIFDEDYKRRFCIKHNIERNEDITELLAQIKLFARNTHTIGNYMPCPVNRNNEPDNKYNKLKGFGKGYKYFKDRSELLYLELLDPKHPEYLSDRRDAWKNWFYNNKKYCY